MEIKSKKIINDPTNVVNEMIDGYTSSNNLLKLNGNYNIVVRSDFLEMKDEKVTLISGGGSGHEPSHIGFIGKGMLTGVVCGQVFASPSAKQIFMAIKSIAGKAGCLLIVKNYMGDIGSFKIAKEMCKLELPNIRVEMIIVDDDISTILMKSKEKEECSYDDDENYLKSFKNRRGIAGTVLVHKIIGSLAEQGKSIDEIIKFYNEFISPSKSLNLVTMGVALSSCTIPSIGTPLFNLSPNEMEIGLGIHGEFGIEKVDLKPSKIIVKTLLDHLIKLLELPIKKLNTPPSLILLINNLGSTTNMEMTIVLNDCLNYLKNEKRFNIKRVISGTLMTSLEMAGISLSLLLSNDNDNDDTLIECIDYPTNAMSWPTNNVLKLHENKNHDSTLNIIKEEQEQDKKQEDNEILSIKFSNNKNSEIFKQLLISGLNSLIDAKDILTELDKQVGDGDLGCTLFDLSNSIKDNIELIEFDKPCFAFKKISNIILETIGGSSGLFYTIFFMTLSTSLFERSKNLKIIKYSDWGNSLLDAVNSIKEMGNSDIGDCTMLDSLIPAINEINNFCQQEQQESFDLKNVLKIASNASKLGAETTIDMIAKKGRSLYIGERSSQIMDPGAKAINLIFESLYNSISNQ